MTNNARVLNLTRGFTLKHKQALRAIEECACAWLTNDECDSENVPRGTAIRDLTLAESITRRNQQAKDREPLPNIEIPGLSFAAPVGALASFAERSQLVREANQLFSAAVA